MVSAVWIAAIPPAMGQPQERTAPALPAGSACHALQLLRSSEQSGLSKLVIDTAMIIAVSISIAKGGAKDKKFVEKGRRDPSHPSYDGDPPAGPRPAGGQKQGRPGGTGVPAVL